MMNSLLSEKAQREAGENHVGPKGHQGYVQIWGINVIDGRLVRQSARNRLADPSPMPLEQERPPKHQATGKKEVLAAIGVGEITL